MASIPAVKELERRYGARGLRVVSVTRNAERSDVQRVMKSHQMDYPCLLDDAGWSKRAGVEMVPAFLLVDARGRLAYRHVGKLLTDDDAMRELAATVERLLAGS